mgnify:CR=1 FL=1
MEQGREAMRLLQERFDEKEQERRIGKRVMVPCRLILRGSGNMKTVTESARKKKLAGKKEKESRSVNSRLRASWQSHGHSHPDHSVFQIEGKMA